MTPSALLLLTMAAMSVIVWLVYHRAMRAARARLANRSSVIDSPYGDIEYAQGGAGPNVLIIHGAAGGWDQGALIGQAIFNSRLHWIAPSRFGYLRSGRPEDASVEAQAHAYAFLLDHLGIGRVAVVAVSAGGPSALAFSILHPERVASLSLISCGVRAPMRATSRLFESDFLFWLTTRLFRQSLLRALGVDAAGAYARSLADVEWIDNAVAAMHPASLRAAGVAFDRRAPSADARIGEIEAPTLIVHAKNDALEPHQEAVYAAAAIPGARLVSFESGGQLLCITMRGPVGAIVEQHIRSHFFEVPDAAHQPTAA